VFSAYGLREGHLFASLTPAEKAKDSLISACAELAEAEGRFGDLGRLLQNWIEPVFRDAAAEARRLRLAACTLSDIGWRDHPDYRAEQAFTRILRLPIAGIDHKGRVAIALAVFLRYGGEEDLTSMHSVLAMLNEEEREHWQSVGLALRLAYALSAATPAILRRSSLAVGAAKLTLRLPKGHGELLGEAVERRLQALAGACGKAFAVALGEAKRGSS
jgi:exopolyphosphatase/guanosine-5'-triphosphate,3'-diphosphate pyrophosphatase